MPHPVHTTVDSPVGTLTLVARDGALVGLYMHEQRHRPAPETFGDRDDDAEPFATTKAQLAEYFAGARREFDLPLAPSGTPFQERVWAALREIPYGETTSYGELAEHIGSPGAARAVGLANGRNPIGIVVPCHRRRRVHRRADRLRRRHREPSARCWRPSAATRTPCSARQHSAQEVERRHDRERQHEPLEQRLVDPVDGAAAQPRAEQDGGREQRVEPQRRPGDQGRGPG
jgi:methylated-DNA-[protein]-cysteine S-methyltransferase